MDASDKPVLPVALKLREAFNVVERMVAENRSNWDAVASLPADRQEQEKQRLIREREQIGVLGNVLQGLIAATLETIKDEHYQPVLSKLEEALHVAKRMLDECSKGPDAESGLPPERCEEGTQGIDRDLEFIGALVRIVGDVVDGIVEGGGGELNDPPDSRQTRSDQSN